MVVRRASSMCLLETDVDACGISAGNYYLMQLILTLVCVPPNPSVPSVCKISCHVLHVGMVVIDIRK